MPVEESRPIRKTLVALLVLLITVSGLGIISAQSATFHATTNNSTIDSPNNTTSTNNTSTTTYFAIEDYPEEIDFAGKANNTEEGGLLIGPDDRDEDHPTYESFETPIRRNVEHVNEQQNVTAWIGGNRYLFPDRVRGVVASMFTSDDDIPNDTAEQQFDDTGEFEVGNASSISEVRNSYGNGGNVTGTRLYDSAFEDWPTKALEFNAWGKGWYNEQVLEPDTGPESKAVAPYHADLRNDHVTVRVKRTDDTMINRTVGNIVHITFYQLRPSVLVHDDINSDARIIHDAPLSHNITTGGGFAAPRSTDGFWYNSSAYAGYYDDGTGEEGGLEGSSDDVLRMVKPRGNIELIVDKRLTQIDPAPHATSDSPDSDCHTVSIPPAGNCTKPDSGRSMSSGPVVWVYETQKIKPRKINLSVNQLTLQEKSVFLGNKTAEEGFGDGIINMRYNFKRDWAIHGPIEFEATGKWNLTYTRKKVRLWNRTEYCYVKTHPRIADDVCEKYEKDPPANDPENTTHPDTPEYIWAPHTVDRLGDDPTRPNDKFGYYVEEYHANFTKTNSWEAAVDRRWNGSWNFSDKWLEDHDPPGCGTFRTGSGCDPPSQKHNRPYAQFARYDDNGSTAAEVNLTVPKRGGNFGYRWWNRVSYTRQEEYHRVVHRFNHSGEEYFSREKTTRINLTDTKPYQNKVWVTVRAPYNRTSGRIRVMADSLVLYSDEYSDAEYDAAQGLTSERWDVVNGQDLRVFRLMPEVFGDDNVINITTETWLCCGPLYAYPPIQVEVVMRGHPANYGKVDANPDKQIGEWSGKRERTKLHDERYVKSQWRYITARNKAMDKAFFWTGDGTDYDEESMIRTRPLMIHAAPFNVTPRNKGTFPGDTIGIKEGSEDEFWSNETGDDAIRVDSPPPQPGNMQTRGDLVIQNVSKYQTEHPPVMATHPSCLDWDTTFEQPVPKDSEYFEQAFYKRTVDGDAWWSMYLWRTIDTETDWGEWLINFDNDIYDMCHWEVRKFQEIYPGEYNYTSGEEINREYYQAEEFTFLTKHQTISNVHLESLLPGQSVSANVTNRRIIRQTNISVSVASRPNVTYESCGITHLVNIRVEIENQYGEQIDIEERPGGGSVMVSNSEFTRGLCTVSNTTGLSHNGTGSIIVPIYIDSNESDDTDVPPFTVKYRPPDWSEIPNDYALYEPATYRSFKSTENREGTAGLLFGNLIRFFVTLLIPAILYYYIMKTANKDVGDWFALYRPILKMLPTVAFYTIILALIWFLLTNIL